MPHIPGAKLNLISVPIPASSAPGLLQVPRPWKFELESKFGIDGSNLTEKQAKAEVERIKANRSKSTPLTPQGLPEWQATIRAGNIETGVRGRALGPNQSWSERLIESVGLRGVGKGVASTAKWAVVAVVALGVIMVLRR